MAFKILSIDGGGLRGIVPVMILQELEKRTGKRIFELFDMVAGTSAGAFITSGVTLSADGKTPKSSLKDIEEVYTRRGKEIFPPLGFFKNVASLFGSAFNATGVENVLKDMAADLTMKNCLRPILIPAYDYANNEALFFKKRHADQDAENDAKLFDICRATSAAPTFYDPYEMTYKGKRRLCVDGGIFMNNPSVAALVEASRYRDYYKINDFSDISVLSIGTGHYEKEAPVSKSKGWGKLFWASPISDVMMQAAGQTACYQADEVLENDKFLRVNFKIENKKYADFTDSSKETLDYIMNKVSSDILQNEPYMQLILDFVNEKGTKKLRPV